MNKVRWPQLLLDTKLLDPDYIALAIQLLHLQLSIIEGIRSFSSDVGKFQISNFWSCKAAFLTHWHLEIDIDNCLENNLCIDFVSFLGSGFLKNRDILAQGIFKHNLKQTSSSCKNFLRMLRYSLHTSHMTHQASLISGSVAWNDQEYFSSSLDGMLVHHRVTPSMKFAVTHLYTWVERGTARVKNLPQ